MNPTPTATSTLASPATRPLHAAVAALALVLAGCAADREERGAAPADGEPAGADVAIYDVRGVVLALPDPARPRAGMRIRHEAIDDFAGIDGEVVGMDSMTMVFPLAEGVGVGGIEVGDQVAFTLEVEWEGEPPYRLTHLEELPPGTELEFRPATPPAP
ncbi:MAG TPA: copper-binding protein [Thermoanaerobaculia bacterium]|nr:copper-binding protein [Thermoanaerobaculia bacterium]